MSTGLKANPDGSAAIQVGGTDVITLTSGGAATFVTSPTTVQAGTAAAPSITFSGDTNTGIYSPGADQVAIATGGSKRFEVDAAGNAGLGVTPSAWSGAHKAIQIGNSALSAFTNNINYVYLSTNWVSSSGDKYISNGAAAVYAQDTGSHIFYSAPSGTAGNAATFTQVMSVERTKTLALEGAVSQSGTGITFPATQSASSNANTLDDYEEGTFTPTFVGTGGVTYASSETGGFYQKVGNTVHFQLTLSTSSLTTNSNSVVIGGLPFTVSSVINEYYVPCSTFIQRGWKKTGILFYQPLINRGQTTIQVYGASAGSGDNYVTIIYTDASSATWIRISGSYRVD